MADPLELGHRRVRLEDLRHIRLAAREALEVLGHRRVRNPVDLRRIETGPAQVVLQAHPRGWHLARSGNAQALEVDHLEPALEAAPDQDEGVARHDLPETDQWAIRVAVVMQHYPHRPAPRDVGAAIQQPLRGLDGFGRQPHLDVQPLGRPITPLDR